MLKHEASSSLSNATTDDIDIQHTTREFVRREVYANVGEMVEYILEADDPRAPFHWEDITNMYPDPDNWEVEELEAWIVDNHSQADLDNMLEMNLDAGDPEEGVEPDNYMYDLRYFIRDNAEAAEVYEWWLVSNWLAEKLSERGEVIIEPNIWGRQAAGQAVYMDGIMQDIAMEFAPVTK
jgi:hypothetical protein